MPKHYYQIGEVANMLGVRKHTLRYWEAEFPKFNPHKNNSGKRSYTLEDIEILKKIKFLLYEQNFSIEGARKKMAASSEITVPEELSHFSKPHAEIKKKLTAKIEKIQDTITLNPAANQTLEKKREIREKINRIKELLINKKKQEDFPPASSDYSSLD